MTSPSPRQIASITRRAVLLAALLAAALLVAAGCSGDDVDRPAKLGGNGALRWLPADTWLVATGDLSAARIDEAVDTLGRLPIWALVEGELPASDGEGLRAALLEQVAEAAAGPGETATLDAAQLERAFGNRVGFAIFDQDLEGLDDGGDAGLVAWVHVDDETLARDAALELFDGEPTEREHDGIDYFELPDDEATFVVRDELLLVTTSPSRMEQLIDVREGDEPSLAGDDTAGAMIDAGIGEAFAGAAINTDALLDALGRAARAQEQQQGAVAIGDVLDSGALDDLAPDWVANSVTIDDVGLRLRATWSNPRELAEPATSARELVERMPASAATVSGIVTDGSVLTRVQAAWKQASEAADLDLRREADCDSRDEHAWACRLALEAGLAILEDDDLASALDAQPDSATVIVQDLAPLFAALLEAARSSTPTAQLSIDERWLEVATTATSDLDWTAPRELATAMREAGLQVSRTDAGGVRVKAAPNSPLARALRDMQKRVAPGDALANDATAQLLTPQGMLLQPATVDGVNVFGMPQDAPSAVVRALEGDVDRVGDLDAYERVVEAVDPPEAVGSWGWLHVAQLAEDLLGLAASESPEIARVIPTVRNNLDDVPGMLAWSTREDHDGEAIGVAEAVLPILE